MDTLDLQSKGLDTLDLQPKGMDTLDLPSRGDGLQLIVEPGYTLEELQENIRGTCLAEKCDFIMNAQDVPLEEIYKKVLDLLNGELNLDEITSLFVVVGMLYFIGETPDNIEWRMHLIQKAFNYTDTLSPMHLHLATKRLWQGLKKKEGDAFNVLTLCDHMVIASETGRAISICLMWAILSEITDTPNEMYCFRPFSKIIEMLKNTDNESLQDDESMPHVYILVQVISFLMNTIVYDGRNEDLMRAGYRKCFEYNYRDLKRLWDWCDDLRKIIKSPAKYTDRQANSEFTELRMLITRHITFNIINVLQEKIDLMHHE